MLLDERLAHYRELNVSYGTLEGLHRLRYELSCLRRIQREQMKRGPWQKAVAACLLVTAAVPAIYALIPEDSQKRLWLIGLIALAAIYFFLCYSEFRAGGAIPGADLTIDAYIEPEDSPRFLSLLLNSYRTRYDVVQGILREFPNEPKCEGLDPLRDYFRNMMLSVAPDIERLVKQGKLTPERRTALLSYFPEEFRPT